MKLFNGKTSRALIVGLSLLAGTAVVHADSESGLVKLVSFATGAVDNDGVIAKLASPDPLGSGTCGGGGEMTLLLNGEGSKALYATLLAANINGKTVTLNYVNESGSCLLGSATLN